MSFSKKRIVAKDWIIASKQKKKKVTLMNWSNRKQPFTSQSDQNLSEREQAYKCYFSPTLCFYKKPRTKQQKEYCVIFFIWYGRVEEA